MTKITAKVLVASSDKTYMLPAADDPKPASNQPLQASAPELRRAPLPRLSEKGKRSLPCSLTEHQNGIFDPYLPPSTSKFALRALFVPLFGQSLQALR